MARHFVLCDRAGTGSPWCPQFGDHDRAVVVAERQEYRDNGIRAGNLKIICSNSARQSCVDYCIAYLNQGVQL